MTNKELAVSIINEISTDINSRTGFGVVWRQISVTRKKEIIDAWEHRIIRLLEAEEKGKIKK